MQKKGRMMLLVMLVFFLVPIIVVMLMYKLNWKPNGTSIGELITPARLIVSSPKLRNSELQLITPEFWKDRWAMVYVADNCAESCLLQLHNMRQIHVSLYKDVLRVQRVLITQSNDVADIKKAYPDLSIINQPVEEVTKLEEQFTANSPADEMQKKDATIKAGNLYLVDPLGHIMMRYNEKITASKIQKELNGLLKYSWAG